MADHRIIIDNGRVRFVYDDELLDVAEAIGDAPVVCRVSDVEPHRGGWIADMTKALPPEEAANAVLLGANGTWFKCVPGVLDLVEPFKTRGEALAAERAWLTKEQGL